MSTSTNIDASEVERSGLSGHVRKWTEENGPNDEIEPAVDPDSETADCSASQPWFQDAEQIALLVVLLGCLSVLIWWYWQLVNRQPSGFKIDRTSDDIGYQIDVNSATWVELQQLEAIGPVLAKRIVSDRDRNGPFTTIDELQRVSGIGPKTLDRNRRWMKVTQDRSD